MYHAHEPIAFVIVAGPVPSSFGSFSKLKELNLQKNYLTSLPPSLFELGELEYLFVDYNRFTGEIPEGVTNLTTLTQLQLGYNSELCFLT